MMEMFILAITSRWNKMSISHQTIIIQLQIIEYSLDRKRKSLKMLYF